MSQKQILVLEDEKALQTSIRIKLEHEGYKVQSSTNVDDAIKILETAKTENETFSLFWVDHYLEGGKTGLDFVTFVKASNEFKKVPIFVITNFEDYNNAAMFMEKVNQTGQGGTASYLNFKIEKFFVKSNSSLEKIIEEVKRHAK